MSGAIDADTVWSLDNSPYLVHGPITIPADVTLSIEPGVVVDIPYQFLTDGKGTFNVAGTLEAIGTPHSPVEFDGGGRDWNTSLAKVDGEGAATAEVLLQHTVVHDFTAVVGVTSAGGQLRLEDSHVYRTGGLHLSGTRPGSVVARNLFEDAGGVSLYGSSPASVIDNRFRDIGTNGYVSGQPFVQSVDAGGVPAQVHGNTFEPHALTSGSSPRPALSTAINGAMDATGNYWASTDIQGVKQRVLDHEDNPTWAWTVPVEPVLLAPSAATPTTVPQPVRDLGHGEVGPTAATVTWGPPASDGGTPITGFRVDVPALGSSVTVGPADRAFALSGLAPMTEYDVAVTAINANGSSVTRQMRLMTDYAAPSPPPYSPVPTVAPPAEVGSPRPPDAPSRPQVTYRRGKLIASWLPGRTNGSPVTGFRATAKKRGSKAVVIKTSRTNAVFKRLKPGRYAVRVVALSQAGASEPSRPAKIRIPRT